MEKLRKIIHFDLDAFYCAVEELRNPKLVGKPFAVGGRPDARGVVASCSYPARIQGVRSAMPMRRAKKLCPELIIVPHNFLEYREASHKVMRILRSFTILVEQLSIDEAFLDITEISSDALDVGSDLHNRVLLELGLPNSLGIATNKLVAKIANDVGKSEKVNDGYPPNSIKVVPPGTEDEFLAPLTASMLWGVGPKTASKLSALGVKTIGDLAKLSPDLLRKNFGKHGDEMAFHAKGIDKRQVVTHRPLKSISEEITFAKDVRKPKILLAVMEKQAVSICKKLKGKEKKAVTIKIKVRWNNFETITRQTTLSYPTDNPDEIYQTSVGLFRKIWRKGRAVRLIGVGVSGIYSGPQQLKLF